MLCHHYRNSTSLEIVVNKVELFKNVSLQYLFLLIVKIKVFFSEVAVNCYCTFYMGDLVCKVRLRYVDGKIRLSKVTDYVNRLKYSTILLLFMPL